MPAIQFTGDTTFVTCLVISPEELNRWRFIQSPTFKVVVAEANVHGYRFDQIVVTERAYKHCYDDGDHGRQWLDDLRYRLKRPGEVNFL